MRFNKQELATLASQPAHKYEKEGVLVHKEKTDGFFRRNSETLSERWFKLSGNLLFYLRTVDNWSEPLGVIVLENYSVQVDPLPSTSSQKSHAHHQAFPFTIAFHSGGSLSLSARTESERTSWIEALQNASIAAIRTRVERLKSEIQSKYNQHSRVGRKESSDSGSNGVNDCSPDQQSHTSSNVLPSPSSPIKTGGYVDDVSESPLVEVSVSCDNLHCDAHGRAPNAKIVVHVTNPPEGVLYHWTKYGATEVIERTSNPVFLTTISLRGSDGLNENTLVRFTICDVRERTTNTHTVVGHVVLRLGYLKTLDRTRLAISSPVLAAENHPSTHPGFLSLQCWRLEKEQRCSTESTPCKMYPNCDSATAAPNASAVAPGHVHHKPQASYDGQGVPQQCLPLVLQFSHRRTQSLPPKLGYKLKIPLQNNFGLLLSNPYMQSYRFHSGLGGDIFVQEIMAESKLSFIFPQQLLSLWIAEEKELLQEVIGLGELCEPWHSRQLQIMERHLWLISVYTQARQNLVNHGSKGSYFKQSSAKADPTYEFVPLNLHYQRMCAQNDTLRKSGLHDTITCGAFTAYAQSYDRGGLVKLLQAYKVFGEKGAKWYLPNKVNITYDSVQGIKRLRKEILERMQVIMKLAKERKADGMVKYVEEIYHRCRLLLTICDQTLIEEAFDFFERQKLSIPTSQSFDNDSESMEELRPSSRLGNYSTKSGFQSHHSQIDEGIETPNSPLRSLVDLFKKRGAELGNNDNEDRTPDSGLGIDEVVKSFLDSPSSNYYRPTEEPEPWDLTQLNIEAAVISLNSKIRVLCGQGVDIEHRSLRPASLITRVHSVHGHDIQPFIRNAAGTTAGIHWRKSLRDDVSSDGFVKPISSTTSSSHHHFSNNNNNITMTLVSNGTGRTEGVKPNSNPIISLSVAPTDWSEELRSSVKKLRLAMDGLLKTSRLAHSIFRLQENNEKSQLGYIVKYRRDVCFSHALTTLVAGLMGKLWCRKPEPNFLYILTRLGPLVSFHSFLTCHFSEGEMLGDMIVAIEDLKTVEFVLVMNGNDRQGQKARPFPKVHGSRSNLKVFLPVPEGVFSIIPMDSTRSTSFFVTPVFFNIGINEHATIAERVGNIEQQEKSNLDNFARLHEYHCRFNKLTLPVNQSSHQAPDVEKLIFTMHKELLSRKKKNVEVIHLSAQITRALNGIRYTSCKSGKDRTSMSVTLEQVQILSKEYDLWDEHEFQLALDAMRSEGCRRENTLKNIGHKKYAFNSLQAFALPKAYRPPPGTFGNVQS